MHTSTKPDMMFSRGKELLDRGKQFVEETGAEVGRRLHFAGRYWGSEKKTTSWTGGSDRFTAGELNLLLMTLQPFLGAAGAFSGPKHQGISTALSSSMGPTNFQGVLWNPNGFEQNAPPLCGISRTGLHSTPGGGRLGEKGPPLSFSGASILSTRVWLGSC